MELGFSLSSEEHRPTALVEQRMKSRGFEAAFATHPDGRLWGLVSRADLERALGEARP